MLTRTQLLSRNNISISGNSDRAMLFAHGYGCDQNMWRFLVAAFADRFTLVLFDHVGSGKSDRTAYDFEKYSYLHGYADDVIEICEQLQLKNVIFVGHSVGAMIGLLAAIKSPHYFESMIMIAPSPCYINREHYFGGFSESDIQELLVSIDSNYLGWSSAMAPAIMGNADRPHLANELENSFCSNDPVIAQHFARVTFLSDHRKDLPLLKTNTLVIQCPEDLIAPLAVGEFVASQIEKASLKVLKATGHCPHLSAPAETIEAINSFLN